MNDRDLVDYISMLIVDELHEWLPETWAVLTNGTVGRRRAQIVQITTAGDCPASNASSAKHGGRCNEMPPL